MDNFCSDSEFIFHILLQIFVTEKHAVTALPTAWRGVSDILTGLFPADFTALTLHQHMGPAAHRDPLSPAGSSGASDGITGEFEFVADRVSEATVGDALRLSIQIPDGRAAEIGETNGRTGWEAERESFLSSPVSDAVHSLG